MDNDTLRGMAIAALGRVHRLEGRADVASEQLQDAVERLRRGRHAALTASAAIARALVALERRDGATARSSVLEALVSWWNAGLVGRLRDAYLGTAAVCGMQGRAREAGWFAGAAEAARDGYDSALWTDEASTLERIARSYLVQPCAAPAVAAGLASTHGDAVARALSVLAT